MRIRFVVYGIMVMLLAACTKSVELELPEYDPEIVVEMYLEDGKQLLCRLSESKPYTDEVISSPLEGATVVLQYGNTRDTLKERRVDDWDAGRWYNYSNFRRLSADPGLTYTLEVKDAQGREVKGSTRFLPKTVKVDKIHFRKSDKGDSSKVGILFQDPEGVSNYYRILIARKLNEYSPTVTDEIVADFSFDGQAFSLFSNYAYASGETVMIRLYSLHPDHYEYLQVTENARVANFNPFVQPTAMKSGLSGGIGIFTVLQYDQRIVQVP